MRLRPLGRTDERAPGSGPDGAVTGPVVGIVEKFSQRCGTGLSPYQGEDPVLYRVAQR